MTTGAERRADLAAAVASLLDSLDGVGAFEAGSFQTILRALTRYLQATVPMLDRDEVVDVIDGAILELIELARNGGVNRNQNPAGLLIRLAHRRGIDLARRHSRQDLSLEEVAEIASEEGDELLEAIASEEAVKSAMLRIRTDGRDELNDVIRTWQDLADRFGTVTVRDLAARLQVGAGTISRRLAEIRRYLEE